MNVLLGQYLPGNSMIHRLDPRTKLLGLVLFIVLVFVTDGLVTYLLPAAFIALVMYVAKIPARYLLGAVKPMKWLLLMLFLFNLFLSAGTNVLWSWGVLRITAEGLEQAVYISLRLVILVSGTSLLTLTTSPLSLTEGLERVVKPLEVLKFPAHELAMMMSIALRFIPVLMEETDRIRKAQLVRGADFESGKLLDRAKAMLPLLIPLFVSAFRRADELAVAMESRCYMGGEGRTRMKELRYEKADGIAVLVMLLFVGAAVALRYVPGI